VGHHAGHFEASLDLIGWPGQPALVAVVVVVPHCLSNHRLGAKGGQTLAWIFVRFMLGGGLGEECVCRVWPGLANSRPSYN